MSLFFSKTNKSTLSFLILFLCGLWQITAQQDATKNRDISGPASVKNQLENDEDGQGLKTWFILDSLDNAKERFYDRTGFKIGGDYNSQIMAATDAIGNNVGASGAFRIYGQWNLVNHGSDKEGGIVFKVENRHKYTENALREYGPVDLGYAGLLQSVYSNQGWRATNLYWRQEFGKSTIVAYGGFVDITDWTDVYAVASPWQSFNNLVFATGSGALGGAYPDGSMGLMISGWLTDNLYAVGSLVDANGDATQFWKGFDTFFSDFETVKTFELGYSPGAEMLFLRNIHLTVWQVDARTEANTPSGWGIIGSASWALGAQYQYLPFLRFGWAKDGFAFYEYSISTGIAFNIAGPNTLGIGLNYNKPNESTFGIDLDPQFTGEVFYKFKLTHHSEITPNIQFLGNPAFNPDNSFIAVFGLRGRFFF